MPLTGICKILEEGDPSDAQKAAQLVSTARMSALLYSGVTPAKNLGFTGLNIQLNTGSHFLTPALEAILEKVRPMGERERTIRGAVEGLRGLFSGMNGSLGKYARETKRAREVLLERPSLLTGKTKAVMEAPFDVLRWGDGWMHGKVFSSEWNRLATEKVLRKSPGLSGTALQRRVDMLAQAQVSRYTDLSAEATKAARAKLAKYPHATEAHVRDQANSILSHLMRTDTTPGGLTFKLAQENTERSIYIAREGLLLDNIIDTMDEADAWGLLSVFAPFRRTPLNEAREFLRATPLGIFNAATKYGRMVKQGFDPVTARAVALDEVSRMIMGTAITGGLAGLMMMGVTKVNNFRKNESRAQRETERAAGTRSDMLDIPALGMQVPLRNLGPLGRAFALIQNSFDEVGKASDEGAMERVFQGFQSVTQDIVTQIGTDVFMDDVVGFWDAMQDENSGKTWAARFGGSFIPSFARQTGPNFFGADVTVNETPRTTTARAFMEGALEPLGLTESRPRLGLFGKELTRPKGPGSLVGAFIGEESDPLAQRMLDVGLHKEPPQSVTNLDVSFQEDLTIRKAKGEYQRRLVQGVVNRPGFDQLPLERQKALMNRAFNQASTRINRRAKFAKARGVPITTQVLVRVGS